MLYAPSCIFVMVAEFTLATFSVVFDICGFSPVCTSQTAPLLQVPYLETLPHIRHRPLMSKKKLVCPFAVNYRAKERGKMGNICDFLTPEGKGGGACFFSGWGRGDCLT